MYKVLPAKEITDEMFKTICPIESINLERLNDQQKLKLIKQKLKVDKVLYRHVWKHYHGEKYHQFVQSQKNQLNKILRACPEAESEIRTFLSQSSFHVETGETEKKTETPKPKPINRDRYRKTSKRKQPSSLPWSTSESESENESGDNKTEKSNVEKEAELEIEIEEETRPKRPQTKTTTKKRRNKSPRNRMQYPEKEEATMEWRDEAEPIELGFTHNRTDGKQEQQDNNPGSINEPLDLGYSMNLEPTPRKDPFKESIDSRFDVFVKKVRNVDNVLYRKLMSKDERETSKDNSFQAKYALNNPVFRKDEIELIRNRRIRTEAASRINKMNRTMTEAKMIMNSLEFFQTIQPQIQRIQSQTAPNPQDLNQVFAAISQHMKQLHTDVQIKFNDLLFHSRQKTKAVNNLKGSLSLNQKDKHQNIIHSVEAEITKRQATNASNQLFMRGQTTRSDRFGRNSWTFGTSSRNRVNPPNRLNRSNSNRTHWNNSRNSNWNANNNMSSYSSQNRSTSTIRRTGSRGPSYPNMVWKSKQSQTKRE